MGTAAFERDAVVEIDGQKYRLLRKVSETCWQLEHTSTARISELEQEQLLRMYADRKLRFAKGVAGIGRGKVHIEISETAKLRRLYVLAALKTDTLTDLKQAISKVWRKTNSPRRPPGCKSVYRWKTRFLESGSDIRALEDEQRTGNRMKRFPSEVLEICELSVDTVYMRRERKHLQDVLDQAIVKVREENRLRPASMALPLPTRRLVKRLVEEIPAFERYTARYGHDAALRFAIVARGRYGSVEAKASIVRAMPSRKLAVVGNIDGTVAGLLVSNEAFQRLAHGERARANEGTNTIAEAARKLECNTRSVRRLVELEWLRPSQTSKAFRITEESIAEFKKQYVSLLSIARTTKSASWALQNICKRCNLPMLVARQSGKKSSQAFIRAEQRQELLCVRSGRSQVAIS